MKKFFKKNYGYFIVGGLLLLFVLFSIFIDDKTGAVEPDLTISEWVESTKTDEYIVTVIGSTTCPHCSNYKPVVKSVMEEHNVRYYWFYADELSESDYETLSTTYNLENYEGSVPYTFVVKNGEFITDRTGEMDNETLVKFLKDLKIIK